MAAPIRQVARGFWPIRVSSIPISCIRYASTKKFYGTLPNACEKLNNRYGLRVGLGAALVGGLAAYLSDLKKRFQPVVHASESVQKRPQHTPIRSIRHSSDNTGLKLTLYQYQTCPFCCKVRSYLDYHGFSYDVVEVNSVWRTQIKWSKYKKVPILVCDDSGPNGFLQLNDSSVIISSLETLKRDSSQSIDKITTYYPMLESKENRKTVYECPNKYFIMYGDQTPQASMDQLKEERRWRRWVDEHLVHMLSPNIYRTPSEALAAFKYFSDVGNWEEVFSNFERSVVIYVGAAAMLVIGKLLKRKYSLKSDERESLYDSCREWTKAIGKRRKFMGGDAPNLADLAMYGALSSIEGCQAFTDLMEATNIGPWYRRTKEAVNTNAGAQINK